jgi:PhoD-like phosphatase
VTRPVRWAMGIESTRRDEAHETSLRSPGGEVSPWTMRKPRRWSQATGCNRPAACRRCHEDFTKVSRCRSPVQRYCPSAATRIRPLRGGPISWSTCAYCGETDPDLQAAHARFPWIITWDDHEVENDYTGALSENNDPRRPSCSAAPPLIRPSMSTRRSAASPSRAAQTSSSIVRSASAISSSSSCSTRASTGATARPVAFVAPNRSCGPASTRPTCHGRAEAHRVVSGCPFRSPRGESGHRSARVWSRPFGSHVAQGSPA